MPLPADRATAPHGHRPGPAVTPIAVVALACAVVVAPVGVVLGVLVRRDPATRALGTAAVWVGSVITGLVVLAVAGLLALALLAPSGSFGP